MATLIHGILLVCGLIVPVVFAACGLFFMNPVFAIWSEVCAQGENKQSHIEEMVSEISRQAFQLDDVRLRLFLRWLQNHSIKIQNQSPCFPQVAGQVPIEYDLETGVKQWLALFPISGQLWEYHLVLTEISWWRDLDQSRLRKIMQENVGNDS